MDEFRKLPDEFSLPQDEFNQDLNTNIKPKIENKRKERNIIKYLCASSAVLLVLPTYFNVFDMPKNKIKEEPVIIENNNNQNNQNNQSNQNNQQNAQQNNQQNQKSEQNKQK